MVDFGGFFSPKVVSRLFYSQYLKQKVSSTSAVLDNLPPFCARFLNVINCINTSFLIGFYATRNEGL